MTPFDEPLRRAGDTFVLRRATVPTVMVPQGLPAAGDGLAAADIWITSGLVTDISCDARPGDGRAEIDLARAMVWALPVDCHTHVDKGQVWSRTPNPDGTFEAALLAARADRAAHFGADDLRCRANFILDCAEAHGTGALRSHVDADRQTFDTAFAVLMELAEERRQRLHVQLAPFTGPGEDPAFVTRLAKAAQCDHGGVLSAFVHPDPGLDDFLDLVFGLAADHGLALDFHADETLDPESRCLGVIAEAALRHRFDGSILVGHACSLSVQDTDTVARTLDRVARAGIAIVALPLCNAYLQDRHPSRSPRRRGIAPVHEIAARGIPVAIASDNVRDPFHAHGDMDLAEVYRQATMLMHLDHPVSEWPAAISTTPAALLGLPHRGRLTPGGPADLLIFPARDWSEFCARPPVRRTRMRGGLVQDAEPPPFSRLDNLDGMTP